MSLRSTAKHLAKKVLPATLRKRLRSLYGEYEMFLARRALATTSEGPPYLGMADLQALQSRYPFPPEWGYDPQSLEARGLARASRILELPGAPEAKCFLELGCWDGMVSGCLCRMGKDTTAIDNRDIGFDPRAKEMGARLLQMNAARLDFESESFDFVFSFDSFEHFSAPDRVLQEVIRVLKPGGHLLLEFGPLYFSPFGEHAYRSITVPYCQFLFSRDDINEFAVQNGLDPIDFNHVNGWSLDDFRQLWKATSKDLQIVTYCETSCLNHLDLIRTYPSCFRGKSENFHNFVVSNISVLFKKTGRTR